MEELNNKLNSNNPIVISQVFSKIVQIFCTHYKDETSKESEALKFLKEKCLHTNSNISLQAAEAILHLINDNKLEAKSILNDFLSIIATTKCPNEIAFLINNLLICEMKLKLAKHADYNCPYNFKLPQHAFIIMFNENNLVWNAIYKEISVTLRNSDLKLLHSLFKLYKPFFLFILSNPLAPSLITCKEKIWSLIVGYASFDDSLQSNFVEQYFPWMQFEAREYLQVNSDLLIELSELNPVLNKELLILFQASNLVHLIENNFNPLEVIYHLESAEDVDHSIGEQLLITISKSITICPAIYLADLLSLIDKFLNNNVNFIILQIVKSSLLQWIANPSALAQKSIDLCKQILNVIETIPRKIVRSDVQSHFYSKKSNLLNLNSNVYFSAQMAIVTEKLQSESDIKEWLKNIENAPSFFLQQFQQLFYGLFLIEFEDQEVSVKVFQILMKIFNYAKQISSNLLTLILYKLSKTTNSELHLKLLKSLPKMAIIKQNMFKVSSTIQALHHGPNPSLKTLTVSLMFDLWKIENKNYSNLEKYLIENVDNTQINKREFFITRAYVLKNLCAIKPELYGKEIVAHLSKILNECNNPDGDIACAMAIDGITNLCKSEIIDAVTTWATLSPMFENEKRTIVIKSICNLISEIPSLSYAEAYPDLLEKIVRKLWNYIEQQDDKILENALDALTNFNLDLIVAQMPDEYLDEEMLEMRKTAQVLPGIIWVHFLERFNKKNLPKAVAFLKKMVTIEISAFLKFVYQVKSAREPTNFSTLPSNSILRGLITYVKSKILTYKNDVFEEIYVECLNILSEEYSKPLPPLDWCFLQELLHDEKAKESCINIASHQVMLSGTARRLIVNLIEAVNDSNCDAKVVDCLYKNLKFIANSVQPFTLKPFLEITILNAVDIFKSNGQKEKLIFVLQSLKHVLKDENILEANKIVIADIVLAITKELDDESELFKLFLDCIILFPEKSLSPLITSRSIKEVSSNWLERAIIIRSKLALATNLNWLNEIMEIEASHIKSTFVYHHFNKVFIAHRDNPDSAIWLYELLGQIQSILIDKNDKKQIMFLCDVFILATIVFSGHLALVKDINNRNEMLLTFPRAISTLVDTNHWSLCALQSLEWFHHMITNKILPEYNKVFKECLQCLKEDNEFRKNMKWIKYVNVEFVD